jgi:hypothetical protein
LNNNKWHTVNINIADESKLMKSLLEYHGNTIPMEDRRTIFSNTVEFRNGYS